MEWAIAATVGAAIALLVRELVERHERIKTKRANCYHIYGPTEWWGMYGTRVCERCGYQDHVRKEPLT